MFSRSECRNNLHRLEDSVLAYMRTLPENPVWCRLIMDHTVDRKERQYQKRFDIRSSRAIPSLQGVFLRHDQPSLHAGDYVMGYGSDARVMTSKEYENMNLACHTPVQCDVLREYGALSKKHLWFVVALPTSMPAIINCQHGLKNIKANVEFVTHRPEPGVVSLKPPVIEHGRIVQRGVVCASLVRFRVAPGCVINAGDELITDYRSNFWENIQPHCDICFTFLDKHLSEFEVCQCCLCDVSFHTSCLEEAHCSPGPVDESGSPLPGDTRPPPGEHWYCTRCVPMDAPVRTSGPSGTNRSPVIVIHRSPSSLVQPVDAATGSSCTSHLSSHRSAAPPQYVPIESVPSAVIESSRARRQLAFPRGESSDSSSDSSDSSSESEWEFDREDESSPAPVFSSVASSDPTNLSQQRCVSTQPVPIAPLLAPDEERQIKAAQASMIKDLQSNRKFQTRIRNREYKRKGRTGVLVGAAMIVDAPTESFLPPPLHLNRLRADFHALTRCCGRTGRMVEIVQAAGPEGQHPITSPVRLLQERYKSISQRIKHRISWTTWLRGCCSTVAVEGISNRSDRGGIQATRRGHVYDRLDVCGDCFCRVYGVSRTTYTRMKMAIQRGEQTKPKKIRSASAKSLIVHGVIKMVKKQGTVLPHKGLIQLEFSNKQELFDHISKLCEPYLLSGTAPNVSDSTLRRLLKAHTDVSMVKHKMFATCTTCHVLKELVRNSEGEEQARYDIMYRGHLREQDEQRAKYYKHNSKAMEKPDRYMSIMIDGMDQAKTILPHHVQPIKAFESDVQFQIHVVGIVAFGGPMSGAHAYLTLPTQHNNGNMSCTIIQKFVRHAQEQLLENQVKHAAFLAAAGSGDSPVPESEPMPIDIVAGADLVPDAMVSSSASASVGAAPHVVASSSVSAAAIPVPSVSSSSSSVPCMEPQLTKSGRVRRTRRIPVVVNRRPGLKWPDVLYIQMDNCAKDNKNKTLFAYVAYLVLHRVFRKVKLSFLMVGHTHDQVDQVFSRFSVWLSHHDCITVDELMAGFAEAYTFEFRIPAKSYVVDKVIDVEKWLAPVRENVDGYSKLHGFKFELDNGAVRMSTRFMNAKQRKDWQSSAVILDPNNVYTGLANEHLAAHNDTWSTMHRDPSCEVPWEFEVNKFVTHLTMLHDLRGLTMVQLVWWKEFLQKYCTSVTDLLCTECRQLRVEVEKAIRNIPRKPKKGQTEDAPAKAHRSVMTAVKTKCLQALNVHLQDDAIHESQMQFGWWTTQLPLHQARVANAVFQPQQMLSLTKNIVLQPDGTMAQPDRMYGGLLGARHGKDPGQDAMAPIEPGMIVAIRPPMDSERWWAKRDLELPFFYLGVVKAVCRDEKTNALIGVTVHWFGRMAKFDVHSGKWWKTPGALDGINESDDISMLPPPPPPARPPMPPPPPSAAPSPAVGPPDERLRVALDALLEDNYSFQTTSRMMETFRQYRALNVTDRSQLFDSLME